MNLIRGLLIVIMTATALGAAPPDQPVFPYPIDVKDFPNGLRLVGVRFDSPGLAAYYSVVRVGSRHEVDEGKSGFAHFFEHMMFRGTERYPQDEYNAVLKAVGADSNAYTSFDHTAYHILASAESLPKVIEIEADRFQNLKYDKEQFQKEAGAVLGEYNKNATNPFGGLLEKLHDVAYDVHPYQHRVIGFEDDIKAMPGMYDYSLTFFDRFYRPEYVTLLVVGDYDWDEVVSLVEKHYGTWERGNYEPDIPAEPPQEEPRRAEVAWPAPTLPILAIAYRAPAFSTERVDMPGLDVLSQVGFGSTSPIYQELVVEKQWVDFISAGALDQADPPLYQILTRVREPDKLEAVEQVILAEVHRLTEELADAELLEATRSHMKYQFLMGMDTANAVARTMAHYLSLTNDPQTVNRVYELYDEVTAEQIRDLAAKYLVPSGRTIVTLQQADAVKGEEE